MQIENLYGNQVLASAILSFLVGCLEEKALAYVLKERRIQRLAWVQIIVTVTFLWFYGFSYEALRGICFCHVLNMTAVYDRATYQIPNTFCILLAMTGLIIFQPLSAFMGLFIVSLPFCIAGIKGKMGGGDVKLMMASGFVLGLQRGFFMILASLMAAVIGNWLMQKKEKIPLAPYFAVGGFLALFPFDK